jgi:nickel-dependent lactate racemase
MNVTLAYGQTGLEVPFPEGRTTVISPSHTPGLPDERAAVLAGLRTPIGMPPLSWCLQPGQKVCVIFSDITRATPNERIIPWLLEELEKIGGLDIVLLNGTGTHRPNTPEELARLLTPEVTARYRVVNHDGEAESDLVQVGVTRHGAPAWLNRLAVEADWRIVTGFIEPHFFAGFSGGPKGIMPGVAGLKTVMSNHGAKHIGDAQAAFGITEGNPIWEEMRDIALMAGPSFLLNVTLNEQRQITGVFAGDLIGAHRQGIEHVRRSAMQDVAQPFDVVVTTNSGYPLDLNLYQGVKGLSAAARIVRPGGVIILACEAREGVPAGSPMDRLLRGAETMAALRDQLAQPGFSAPEQWQAQILAQICGQARVLVRSSLPDHVLSELHLEPCADIGTAVASLLNEMGPEARVAVLPQGPLTVPQLRSASERLAEALSVLRAPVGKATKRALEEASRQWEACLPFVQAAMEHVASHYDEVDPDAPEVWLALHGLYLAMEKRESRLRPSILQVFTLPENRSDALFGDVPIEDGARILAAVCGANLGPIKDLLSNAQASECVRGEVVGVVRVLEAWGEIERAQSIEFFRSLLAKPFPAETPAVVAFCVCEVLNLGERCLDAEIRRAFADGRVDCQVVTEKEAFRTRDWLPPAFANTDKPGPAADEMSWWGTLEENDDEPVDWDEKEDWDSEPDFDDTLPDWAPPSPYVAPDHLAPQPYVAPPKVGRNEPCPCGSGKKYKKCCGAN